MSLCQAFNIAPFNTAGLFLYGYVKSIVYVDKPETIDVLEDNIRRIIADISPQFLPKSGRKFDLSAGIDTTVAVTCPKSFLKHNAKPLYNIYDKATFLALTLKLFVLYFFLKTKHVEQNNVY